MKKEISNQVTGTLIIFLIFAIVTFGAVGTKEVSLIIASCILGVLTLLFTLNAIKVIKKEKGIKTKYNFNYGLCIGFVVIAALFGISLALFIKNVSYKNNGIETTATVYDVSRTKTYKTEYNDDGSSYEKEEVSCDVFISYVVNGKEYRSKLNPGNCKYSIDDKVKIYYNKDDPTKIESNSTLILIVALLITGTGFIVFIIKCIKSLTTSKKKK